MFLLRRISGALTVAFVLAACSHKDEASKTELNSTTATTTTQTQAQAPSSRQPCDLLSKAQVAAAIHKPIDKAEQTDSTHCMYGPKSGGMNAIIVEAAWSGADAQFQGGQAANSMMGDKGNSPKVGDASYSSAMGNMFYARKGDAYVGIDMRAAAVDVKVVGPKLAREALTKM